MTVAELASDALERPVDELPPRRAEIDLDAFATLVPSTATGMAPDVTVPFTYTGLRVAICSGGTVFVRPIHEDPEKSSPGPFPDEW